MKQTKRSNTNFEEIIRRVKILCFQGQYGTAAEILTSEGFATVNKATLDALKKLHPTEEKPSIVQNFSSQAYQISEENVMEQLNLFSKFTTTGPLNMFAEHLLHAVQCTASYQSKCFESSKLVNVICRGELPECFTGSQ